MYETAFIDDLASPAPTPGGGGASAYAGAIASALASMVGNLTVGKARYAEVEDDMQAALVRLARARARLVELVDEDAQAFEPLAQAYGMPRATPEEAAAKQDALQAALVAACDVPLDIMRQCALVAEECDFLARSGSKLAVSDAGAAVVLARAAVHAASLNVLINTNSMTDTERAARYVRQARDVIERTDARADAVYDYVLEQIS